MSICLTSVIRGGLIAVVAGAGFGCTSFRDCSDVDTSAAASLPERLSETGLYADIQNEVVSQSALEFTPRFPLWTDAAKKRRSIVVPEGERIDTSNPDEWLFPVGTKFFKEFTRDGVRVETRMNMRAADGWTGVAYVWNVLSHPANDEIGLDAKTLAGLGVLHANCSHCHNGARDDQPQATGCYSPGSAGKYNFTLGASLSDARDAAALVTARDVLGKVGDSQVIDRMSDRNMSEFSPSMPPLGTEIVDPDGLAAVEALLAELEARGQ